MLLLRADAVEGDDVGAHVGQHHAGERSGADAREFDDAEARQRAGGTDGGGGGWLIEHVFVSSDPRRVLPMVGKRRGVPLWGELIG
ncbi:hypothetical protein ACVWZZ_003862 [Bradyrhizobium sp. LM6.10]